MLIVLIIVISLFVVIWCMKQDDSSVNYGNIENFKKETVNLWTEALAFHRCMEFSIDSYCNFRIVFDKRKTFIMFSMMIRNDFYRELTRNEYKVQPFLRKVKQGQSDNNFISYFYDFKDVYRKEECERWFAEYISKNYSKYRIEKENGDISVSL